MDTSATVLQYRKPTASRPTEPIALRTLPATDASPGVGEANGDGGPRAAGSPVTGLISRTVRIIGLVVLTTLVAAACGVGGSSSSAPQQPTFSFVIPEGSAELLEQGETLEILPRELIAELGDTIVIENEDDEPHFLGPWFLGPRETLRQRFVTVGVFEGTCSVHPSGEFTVVVEDPEA